MSTDKVKRLVQMISDEILQVEQALSIVRERAEKLHNENTDLKIHIKQLENDLVHATTLGRQAQQERLALERELEVRNNAKPS